VPRRTDAPLAGLELGETTAATGWSITHREELPWGDEGIDGIINEDRLGLDVVYVQAKRWTTTIGRPEIQQFAGALAGKRARKGVFITTSTFSSEARTYVGSIEPKIVLIGGEQLAAFMFEHNVGAAVASTYEVKKVDADFFEED
jgi:restriction system protein